MQKQNRLEGERENVRDSNLNGMDICLLNSKKLQASSLIYDLILSKETVKLPLMEKKSFPSNFHRSGDPNNNINNTVLLA